ncbi:hypothetical protein D3C71_685110 [compost metagenome]
MAQQPMADAVARHRTKRFLHALERIGASPRAIQPHGIHGGKPSDGARQVKAAVHVAAMAFHVHGNVPLAGPGGDRPRQRRQQHIVDSRAIGSRRRLQQRGGLDRIKRNRLDRRIPDRTRAIGVCARQRPRVHRRQSKPVLALCLRRLALFMQCARPILVARGLGGQHRFPARLRLFIGRLQVFEQDAPRHAIHRQVMDHEQEAPAAFGQLHRQGPHQGALRQIEAALRLLAQGAQRRRIRLPMPQHGADIGGGTIELPRPPLRIEGHAQPQRIMLRHDGRQGAAQRNDIQGFARAQQHRLVPVMRLGDGLRKERLLDWRQQDYALGLARGHRQLDRLRFPGQSRHGLVFEQLPGCDAPPGLAQARDDLQAQDGIAAELEEVIVAPDAIHVQHVTPNGAEGLLPRVARRFVGARAQRVGVRQGLAIHLAVRRMRQLRDGHHHCGHHIPRQVLLQHVLERMLGGAVQRRTEVGHEPPFPRNDNSLRDAGLRQQQRLDLAQFDTIPADLDLIIDAAQVLERAIQAQPRQVSGAIEPPARVERVGHEALGR